MSRAIYVAMEIGYPFQIDGRRRTAEATSEEHIPQLMEQLLFTSPGERVNRPTLGCSLMQLVFSPNSEELSTAVQFLVQGSLQQWLGELIQVERVQVESEDTKLRVTVQYVIRRNQQRQVTEFERGL